MIATQEPTEQGRNSVEVLSRVESIASRLLYQLGENGQVALAGTSFRQQNVGHDFEQSFVASYLSYNACFLAGNARKYDRPGIGLSDNSCPIYFFDVDLFLGESADFGCLQQEIELGEKADRLIADVNVLDQAPRHNAIGTLPQENHIIGKIIEFRPQ
ncbi:MAG: hypothetical protein WBQ63_04115 [Candidatus Acidiferrales bacterium]